MLLFFSFAEKVVEILYILMILQHFFITLKPEKFYHMVSQKEDTLVKRSRKTPRKIATIIPAVNPIKSFTVTFPSVHQSKMPNLRAELQAPDRIRGNGPKTRIQLSTNLA